MSQDSYKVSLFAAVQINNYMARQFSSSDQFMNSNDLMIKKSGKIQPLIAA